MIKKASEFRYNLLQSSTRDLSLFTNGPLLVHERDTQERGLLIFLLTSCSFESGMVLTSPTNIKYCSKVSNAQIPIWLVLGTLCVRVIACSKGASTHLYVTKYEIVE